MQKRHTKIYGYLKPFLGNLFSFDILVEFFKAFNLLGFILFLIFLTDATNILYIVYY